MFGSTNPFGGQQQQQQPPAFGFGSKPFGSPSMSPFGSPAFGGSSTGVFGQPSAPAFGQATASPFGAASSGPAFGAQSAAPAFGGGGFGASSGGFGGSSTFGQKPAFGGFGSTASQGSAFGSTFGASSQPAFGSSLFGSTTPFGAPSQPAFGAASTPAFGATSTPAFGAASTPAFGAASTPAFGSTATPAFGSTPTPLFGSTGAGFGVSSAPAFGSSVTPGFGAQSTSLFGSSSTTAFGAPSTPSFGVSSTPAFGSSSTPSFGFGSTPSFGQPSSTPPSFGQPSSTPFGTTSFGSQSSPFGAQTTTPNFGSPGFGQSTFGGQAVGTRVAPFTPTPEAETGTASQPAGKLESISAMPVYKDKSHEELRWEDYQRNDKGGPNPSGQPSSGITFPTTSQAPNPFGSTPTFGQPPANPFSSTSSNLFAPKTPTTTSTGFGSTSSIFNSAFNSTSPFGQPTTTPAFGAPSTSAFGLSTSSSIFGQPTTTPSSSPFGSVTNFGNTQSSGLFQSSSPSLGQPQSIFGQPSSGFQQPSTGFQQTSTGFQPTTPGLNTNIFSTPSTGFGGNLFSSQTPPLQPSNPVNFGQTTPSFATAFQTTPQTSSAFTFNNNFGQAQQATSAGFGNTFNNGMPGQSATPLPNMVAQPTVITNPFGSLPPVPQMTIGRARSTPSVQYGISSMPVAEEPMPVRISSLVAPRHLSQRRIRLPARKYHPKPDGQRVPFFVDEEVAPTTPKADALFFPRENPRTLIVRPIEQWPSRTTGVKPSVMGDGRPANGNGEGLREPSAPVVDEGFVEDHDGSPDENGHNWENNNAASSPTEPSQKPNGVHAEHAQKGTDSPSITISGHRAGEAAIAYEHGADIEALMPKLRHSDYYTVPRIQELAAKERAKPGFCRHVKDFVVGRQGYGSILFYGETDVRRLDLESIVQFNNREVIVYVEESKKPPVGQGLNKPAEVTLLNIKCMNKKTGQQVTEGPRVEKYREMLMKKTEEQGAEFVSYNPVSGEWKFKVKHFSKYGFGGECLEFSEVDDELDVGDTVPDAFHS